MSQRPIWKDILSGAVRTGGKCVPGISKAIEIIEYVEKCRDDESKHSAILTGMTRVERHIVDVIEQEMRAVLEALKEPNLSAHELEQEIANLYTLRKHGREPVLCEGLIVNSQWYEKLKQQPHLYGRVMQDHDTPTAELFYVCLDADKSRLLELSPFALQQLLARQSSGVPAATLAGRQDIFAVSQAKERGYDLETELPIRPEEATAGTRKWIEFTRRGPCQHCGGVGRCAACAGWGVAMVNRIVEVIVPPGTMVGGAVCIEGEGEPGRGGGPPGNLIVYIRFAGLREVRT